MAIIGKQTLNSITILELDANPIPSPGIAAAVGSLALYSNVFFQKTGAADTAWCRISANLETHVVTTAGTYQVDITTPNLVVFSGSVVGQIVNLGDTRNYCLGHTVELHNDGGIGIDIVNNSGTVLERMHPLDLLYFYLEDNTTANGVWRFDKLVDCSLDMDCYVNIAEDWVTNNVAGTLNWTSTVNGASAAAIINTANLTTNNPGIVQLDTGTSGTGRSALTLGTNILTLSGGFVLVDMQINLPVLSTSAQEYIIRIGFGDNTGSGDNTDGVYFEYNRPVSANWILKTSSNSSRTSVPTTVAVDTNWNDLVFEVNDAGTRVDFFINGVNVGNSVTNIPSGTSRTFGPFLKIEKTNGGTTRQLLVDYYRAFQVFTTER